MLMDQDRPRRRCRRRRRHRRRSAEDHISGLPDELLHSILLRLSSTQAAARTSVLSRRWRPIWTHLPELIFGNASHDDPPPPLPVASSFLDVVDGALAACAAPTLQAFVVVLPTGLNIPAGRVAPWLRFASERVVGELILLSGLVLEGRGHMSCRSMAMGKKKMWFLSFPHVNVPKQSRSGSNKIGGSGSGRPAACSRR
ncbi:unnamed protein product [Urochloa humidicola]